MRLDELTGVKRYKKKTLWDVLDDFQRLGGSWASGKFGTVLLHPRWNYAFKFFTNDVCYLRFIRWAARNPHPCLPRVLSKPKRMVPFYRRHKTENEIYVVKLEKLNEWKYPPEIAEMGGFSHLLDYVALTDFDGGTPPVALSGHHRDRWQSTKDFLNRHPEFKQLADFYMPLMAAPISCEPDIHVANVMQRDDGTLVYVDPFWHGETPYSLERAAREAYMDDDGPEESDFVDGGEKWKAPKKRTPAPPRNFSTDDFPF